MKIEYKGLTVENTENNTAILSRDGVTLMEINTMDGTEFTEHGLKSFADLYLSFEAIK